MRGLIGAFAFLLALVPAQAAPCSTMMEGDVPYSICTTARDDKGLRVFLKSRNGETLGSFSALERELAARGEKLAFAMNGGMYHPDRRPVGLYVENGEEKASLNRRAGPGNFHLRPNGVFWIDARGAHVSETQQFANLQARPIFATQSGPMLVIGGAIHPRFDPDSESRKIRNGVGLCRDGRVRFVISDAPVTFHAFALFFRDRLGCPDALYLDGTISGLHAPDLGRSDFLRPAMGPIVGLVMKK